ncbi:MAG: replication protein RepA [Candidatus Aenigmarchaeota archaeon]|nr:replication protein RepA [Candidatus Aenigmarchaeota archaeon]
MPEEDIRKRLPSIGKKIADIGQEDVRVRILGTVIHKDTGSLVIDDGTGRVTATFDSEPKATVNQLVRVFGRVIPMEEGLVIQGEIIQDMSGLDIELLKKVEEIEKKAREKQTPL